MLSMDFTLVIQFINFIIALIFLNIFLIKPVRKNIAERRALVAGYVSEAEKFNSDATGRVKKYEAALAEARGVAVAEREAIKEQGVAREHAISADAQGKAQKIVQEAKERVLAESFEARTELRSRVDALAAQVARKILA